MIPSLFFVGFKKILNIGKKVLLVIAVYFIVISLFVYFINKDKPKSTYDPIKKNREEIYKIINDPQLNKTKEGKLSIALYRAIMCGMIGEACTDNPADGDKNFNHSLFGFMTNLIVFPYANPPASGVYWAYSGLQNAGFIPKTYAAEGIGLASLTPIKNIWILFRDFLYIILVLILITIGFMIMFRMKINPQTVVSIENSLPKIIIALLLITFSLPIAGFLIDITYIVMGLILLLFQSYTPIKEVTQSLYSNIFLKPESSVGEWFLPSGLTWDTAKKAAASIYLLLPDILQGILRWTISLFGVRILSNFILTKFTGGTSGLKGLKNVMFDIKTRENIRNMLKLGEKIKDAGNPVISIIAALFIVVLDILLGLFIWHSMDLIIVIIFTILFVLSLGYIFLRIFFMLLYSYIQTLILIIFSPVMLVFEAIPGRSAFAAWFKNLIYHLLTWPLLVTLLLVNKALISVNSSTTPSSLWQPPFLEGVNGNAFPFIISTALLFLIPDLIKMFKEMLGIKPLPFQIGMGSFFTGAGAIGGGAMGILSQYSTMSLALSRGPLSRLPLVGRLFGETGPGVGTALKTKPGHQQAPEADEALKKNS